MEGTTEQFILPFNEQFRQLDNEVSQTEESLSYTTRLTLLQTAIHNIVELSVGSHQVPFPMCTLETLQKYCSTGSLLLTFC